jgi:hypothetical protein
LRYPPLSLLHACGATGAKWATQPAQPAPSVTTDSVSLTVTEAYFGISGDRVSIVSIALYLVRSGHRPGLKYVTPENLSKSFDYEVLRLRRFS